MQSSSVSRNIPLVLPTVVHAGHIAHSKPQVSELLCGFVPTCHCKAVSQRSDVLVMRRVEACNVADDRGCSLAPPTTYGLFCGGIQARLFPYCRDTITGGGLCKCASTTACVAQLNQSIAPAANVIAAGAYMFLFKCLHFEGHGAIAHKLQLPGCHQNQRG